MTWRGVPLALALAFLWVAVASAAGPKSVSKAAPDACRQTAGDKARSSPSVAHDDGEAEDDEEDEGIRFEAAGGCVKLTGGASYTYQQAQKTASGLPVIVNRNGTISSSSISNSVSANIGLETTRQTRLGEFKTTVSADWSKATDDGTDNGSAQVSGWSVGLAGLTVGYTGTLMSFWGGDILSTASSPGRSANTVVYEHTFDERHKLAFGLESNLPTTPDTQTGLTNFDFSDPVYTMRWRYESDDLTLHLSGLVRRADFSASPLLPQFPDTATVRTGWAVSFGFKMPVPFLDEDDEVSFQGTYASDASSYLGISNDLVVYQHTVRSTAPTVGWSGVASFHHAWSQDFESNVFASYVTLNANLLLAKPETRTFRSGVNLFWRPMDRVKLGAEIGLVDVKFEPQGVRGIFDGVGGRSYLGILSLSVEL